MLIAGKSGGGKTMTTNLILARILAQGAHGGVIDRAGHYEFLASLIPGAAVVNLGTSAEHAINPWDVTDVSRLASEKLEYLLALHSFFLGRPQPDGTYDLEPRDHSQLSLAIRAVYRRCQLTSEQPRETLLQEELYRRSAEAREDGNVDLASHLAQLAEGLHDYVADGAGAYLADRPTSIPEDSPLVIFDTREVGDARAGAAMFTIVEHLARRSQHTRTTSAHQGAWGGRTFLVVDEGWKMLERSFQLRVEADRILPGRGVDAPGDAMLARQAGERRHVPRRWRLPPRRILERWRLSPDDDQVIRGSSWSQTASSGSRGTRRSPRGTGSTELRWRYRTARVSPSPPRLAIRSRHVGHEAGPLAGGFGLIGQSVATAPPYGARPRK
jgi:hypothetical protein